MLKRSLKSCLRRAKAWLAEKEATLECGTPPFDYEGANCFFKKAMKERGLRRPHYAWGAVQALNLAKMLGIPRISLIEFGVAGGLGLTALERIGEELGPAFGVEVETHGFDAVDGVPKARDYRDLPNLWREGFYPMDHAKLAARLKSAKLHLGLVEETVPAFIRGNPAPVGMIAFDLCLYSSTAKAFQLFEADPKVLLPRVHCFFRNTLALSLGDFNGERLAIAEFNAQHEMRKISKIHGLEHFLRPDVGRWVDQYYMAYVFDHLRYGDYDGLIQQSALELRS